MPVDPSVFNNVKTYQDYKNQQDAVDLQRAQVGAALGTANIDNLTKQNVLKGQYLSAAAGTGNQETWDATKNKLGALGIDTSDIPSDVTNGAKYADALKIAQSSYGALINGGTKLAGVTGVIPGALANLVGGAAPATQQSANTQPIQAPAGATAAPAPVSVNPVNASDLGSDPTIVRAVSQVPNAVRPAVSVPTQTQITMPTKSPTETIDAYKLRPDVIAAQEQAKQQGQIDAKRGAQALETSDMSGLFNKVAKTASTFNGGALGSVTDAVTNAANVSTNSNINRAGFKADVSNLAMAMFRNMSATGRVTRAEGNYILHALPNENDSNGVMIETANNHNQFYNDWMVKRGYDPSSGQKLQPGEQPNLVPQVDNPFKDAVNSNQTAPSSASDYKAGMMKTSPTGIYLFNGGDPTDQKNWKKIKGPQ